MKFIAIKVFLVSHLGLLCQQCELGIYRVCLFVFFPVAFRDCGLLHTVTLVYL